MEGVVEAEKCRKRGDLSMENRENQIRIDRTPRKERKDKITQDADVTFPLQLFSTRSIEPNLRCVEPHVKHSDSLIMTIPT